MKIYRQPWFLILVLVSGIYTYQFYNSSKVVKVGTSEAQAVEKTASTEEAASPTIPVKISQAFKAKDSQNFKLSTYQNIKVKLATTDGDRVIVSLLGEGSQYRNQGEKLSDWFQVSHRQKTLSIQSFDDKGFNGLDSLKKLAKKAVGDEASGGGATSDLTMIIEYPEKHKWNQIKFSGVSNEIFGTGLVFTDFEMASVSGGLKLEKSRGRTLTMESVSGDIHVEVLGLEKVKFNSVSGDLTLTSNNATPELEFGSVSGDLSLNLPGNSQVDVNFESMTGELVNEFGQSGAEGKKLKFGSLSGSATIHKIK